MPAWRAQPIMHLSGLKAERSCTSSCHFQPTPHGCRRLPRPSQPIGSPCPSARPGRQERLAPPAAPCPLLNILGVFFSSRPPRYAFPASASASAPPRSPLKPMYVPALISVRNKVQGMNSETALLLAKRSSNQPPINLQSTLHLCQVAEDIIDKPPISDRGATMLPAMVAAGKYILKTLPRHLTLTKHTPTLSVPFSPLTICTPSQPRERLAGRQAGCRYGTPVCQYADTAIGFTKPGRLQ
jgi:hypothetical protein